MLMPWWVWISLGLILLVVEIMTPGGFYLIFFGVGALLVGTFSGLGWIGSQWVEGVLFSVLSIVALVLFRRPLLNRFKVDMQEKEIDSLIGETATALEEINAGAVGRAELRGTPWSAKNGTDAAIHVNQRCTVEKVEGLMLWIRP